MSDASNEHRPLSQISHLFLSSVRDKAIGGAARPVRTPPPVPAVSPPKNVSLDLTPEEFAQVFGAGEDEPDDASSHSDVTARNVTALITNHLTSNHQERVIEYARHLANDGTRVGMIQVDPSEFRVMCFDRFTGPEAEAPDVQPPAECFDARQMAEVLSELSWDVQRWLLVLPQARVPEARVLLRGVKHWTLLSTCDHDGVIACYRALKGMTDLWPAEKSDEKPQLSLALLDAADEQQADRVGTKLVSVCQQFLGWPLRREAPVRLAQRVTQHVVMCCRPIHDKSQLATAPQWQIVADFISKSSSDVPATHGDTEELMLHNPELAVAEMEEKTATAPMEIPPQPEVLPRPDAMEPSDQPIPITLAAFAASKPASDANDVIDLPGDASSDNAIVEAILRHCSGELVECPISPPMCPKARLAVGRDRRVVMLAVAHQGLADLNMIGLAYKWLQENQALIGMAVPQLSIDTHQSPHLSLLVDQADSAAHTLQPMLQGQHVTVKTYRKLRWGGKTGLLLEAA